MLNILGTYLAFFSLNLLSVWYPWCCKSRLRKSRLIFFWGSWKEQHSSFFIGGDKKIHPREGDTCFLKTTVLWDNDFMIPWGICISKVNCMKHNWNWNLSPYFWIRKVSWVESIWYTLTRDDGMFSHVLNLMAMVGPFPKGEEFGIFVVQSRRYL